MSKDDPTSYEAARALGQEAGRAAIKGVRDGGGPEDCAASAIERLARAAIRLARRGMPPAEVAAWLTAAQAGYDCEMNVAIAAGLAVLRTWGSA